MTRREFYERRRVRSIAKHFFDAATAQIFRCKWCIRRVGSPSWFNDHGDTVAAPEWSGDESRISDGICPVCRHVELSKLADLRKEHA